MTPSKHQSPAETLSAHFAIPDTDTWKAVAEQALKGADFERTLYKKTYEGLTYKGLYTTRPRQEIQIQPRESWQICQFYRDPDLARCLQEITHDHQQGLEAAEIDGRLCGEADLLQQLPQAPADLPLYLRVHHMGPELMEADLPVQGILLDPIGHWVEGYTASSIPAYKSLRRLFRQQAERERPLRYLLQVSSLPYAEAGANAVQELSFILGTCVEVFQKLLDTGVSCEAILAATRVKTSVGTQFFMDLAKMRALRFLLHRLARVYQCEAQSMTIHATTLRRNFSRYDIHSNYLRQTLGATAAVLGGVDGLATNAFNEVNGIPDRFARRMARNIQLVLKHETYFAPLLDPARGSYFLENLTHELAEAAWAHFQGIEQRGGLEMELRTGRLQQEVLQVASLRQRAAETRKDVIVGTNLYALATESLHTSHILPTSQVPDYHVENGIDPLPPQRPAKAFEDLREQRAWQNTHVHLLCLEPGYRPRAEFMEGVFACVGLVPERSPVLASPEGLMEYVAQTMDVSSTGATPATHFVFCSSDSTYEELLPTVLPRLKEAHPQVQWILAGNPGEQKAAYQKLGLDTAFYRGCNVLKGLESLLKPVKR